MTRKAIDAVGMFDTAVEEAGKVFVTTELGGGGTSSARTNAIAKRGVRNVLKHADILAGAVEHAPTVLLDMPSADCFVFCETEGLVEFMVDLGDHVRAGDIIARVFPTSRTGAAPVEYRSKLDGLFTARHVPGLIGVGDCLAVTATVVET